jgi:hypothetical protein
VDARERELCVHAATDEFAERVDREQGAFVRFGDADPQEHYGNAGDRLRRSRPADDRRRDVRGHDPDPLLRDAQQLDYVRGCGPGDRDDPGGRADESEIALIVEASVGRIRAITVGSRNGMRS